jgi:hypothetical protein
MFCFTASSLVEPVDVGGAIVRDMEVSGEVSGEGVMMLDKERTAWRRVKTLAVSKFCAGKAGAELANEHPRFPHIALSFPTTHY